MRNSDHEFHSKESTFFRHFPIWEILSNFIIISIFIPLYAKIIWFFEPISKIFDLISHSIKSFMAEYLNNGMIVGGFPLLVICVGAIYIITAMRKPRNYIVRGSNLILAAGSIVGLFWGLNYFFRGPEGAIFLKYWTDPAYVATQSQCDDITATFNRLVEGEFNVSIGLIVFLLNAIVFMSCIVMIFFKSYYAKLHSNYLSFRSEFWPIFYFPIMVVSMAMAAIQVVSITDSYVPVDTHYSSPDEIYILSMHWLMIPVLLLLNSGRSRLVILINIILINLIIFYNQIMFYFSC